MHKLALVVVLAACAAARIAAANAIDTFDNSCFQAKAIETGLNFPFSIDRLSSKVVFGSSTLGFGGMGSLVAMPIGGGAVQTLLTGLAGPVTGVRLTEDGQTIVVSHGNVNTHTIDFYDANSFAHLAGLTFNYPDANWVHGTSALGIRGDPNVGGATDLFFNVGSEFGTHVGSLQVSVSGLVNASVDQAAVYELVFSRNGDSISASALTEIGSGLRNAFGFEPLPNGFAGDRQRGCRAGRAEPHRGGTDRDDRSELRIRGYQRVLHRAEWAAGRIGVRAADFCAADSRGRSNRRGARAEWIRQSGRRIPAGVSRVAGKPEHAKRDPLLESADQPAFPFLPNQPHVGHPDTMLFWTTIIC
jgi:hypothetical protein